MRKSKSTKTLLASVMALALAASIPMGAFGSSINTAGGTGSADAVLNVEGLTFNVTVPTQLPINVDAAGVVTTAQDAKIENLGAGAVRVSNMSFTPATAWTLVKGDKDMSLVKVGSKEIGMTINEQLTDPTITPNGITFDNTKFPDIAAKVGEETGKLPIAYSAVVAAQKEAIKNEPVGSVVFTIGWAEAEVEAPIVE